MATARSGSRARRTSSSTGPPDSDFADSELRLAHNVLLLERGNLLVRLEGSFNRERAVELARSLRPVG